MCDPTPIETVLNQLWLKVAALESAAAQGSHMRSLIHSVAVDVRRDCEYIQSQLPKEVRAER